MENITEKITEELKAKVVEKLAAQIEARNIAEKKVDRLQKAMADYEEKAVELKGKIQVLNKKIAEALGEGKNVSKKQADLRALREEMGEAEDLAKEIKETALVDARGILKIARNDLKIAVQASVAESRGKYEKQMTQKLLDFMAIYDAWVSATKALYNEVKPGLLAGTIHEIPRVVCEPFKRYTENIGLGIYDKPIPTPTPKEEEKPEEEAEAKPEIEAEIIQEESQEAVKQQV